MSSGYGEFPGCPQDEDLVNDDPYDDATQIHHPVVLTSATDYDPGTQMSNISFQFGNLHVGHSRVRHFLEKLHIVSPRVTLPKNVLAEYRKMRPVLDSFKRESGVTIVEASEWLGRFKKQGSPSMFDHTFKMLAALETKYSQELQSFMSSGIALFDVLDSVSKLREKEWKRLVKTQLKLARARKRQSDPLTLRQLESSYFQHNDQYELSQRTYLAKSRDSYIEIMRNLCQQSIKLGEMLRDDLEVIGNVVQLSALRAARSPLYPPQRDAMAGSSAEAGLYPRQRFSTPNHKRASSELAQRRSNFYPRDLHSDMSAADLLLVGDAEDTSEAADQGEKLFDSPSQQNHRLFAPVGPLRGAQTGLKARDKNALADDVDPRDAIRSRGTDEALKEVVHAKQSRNEAEEESSEMEPVQNENENPWN